LLTLIASFELRDIIASPFLVTQDFEYQQYTRRTLGLAAVLFPVTDGDNTETVCADIDLRLGIFIHNIRTHPCLSAAARNIDHSITACIG
jgi:hypothetical protein